MQMSEKSYSTSDLSRKSGDIIAEALRRPVTITQRNKPRLVLMNLDDYEAMRKRSDPRRVLTIEQLAEVVSADELGAAIDAYENGPDPE
jgi:prevent-host-death family protein